MTTEERTPRSDRTDQPGDEHRDRHPGQEHVEATIDFISSSGTSSARPINPTASDDPVRS